MSGGETNEGGVVGSDHQTAAAATAAMVSGSRLTHAVSPALGYYLMPGTGLFVVTYVTVQVVYAMACFYQPVAFELQNVVD